MKKRLAVTLCALFLVAGAENPASAPTDPVLASILVYHRFGAVVTDSMTVRTSTFRWQLQYLKDRGYQAVPLHVVVAHLLRRGPPPPPRSVVITVDDGHQSVFTDMLPLVREYGVSVTLFIYPSAISNASYAMTWDQLDALKRSGQFDIQSHTYWHPNFKVEKRRLAPPEYRELVMRQLQRSRAVLTQKLGGEVDLIAWPFGIYDEELLRLATECGYIGGLTLDRRPVSAGDSILALPRFLVSDAVGRGFATMLPPESP